MKVVATYNIKGGVGKTSAAVNVAALAVRDGLHTLLWDLDPQAAASYILRVKPKVRGGGERLVHGKTDVGTVLKGADIEGLDVLPADFSYRHMDVALGDAKKPTRRLSRTLAPLGGEYDLAVLDCPPSISLVSESVFESADALIVPIIPTVLSVRTFEQLVRFVEREVERRPTIVGFFSMVDARKRLHRELVASMPAEYPSIVSTSIPAATEVERMAVARAPITESAPRSRAAAAYAQLWREVRDRIGLADGA